MRTHPFKPLIFQETNKLLIGTLPPESARFYFSNSTNTRLWDILNSLKCNSDEVCSNSNKFEIKEKEDILKNLNLGITDIIYQYERDNDNSTRDEDIIPKKYNNILEIAELHDIKQLLFVYKNAYLWFKHSLTGGEPVKIQKLSRKIEIGFIEEISHKNKNVQCILLPAPLNRGRKGETLYNKLSFYREHII